MKLIRSNICEELIDFSKDTELAYWSSALNIRPETLKSAARACCSNSASRIIQYLETNTRLLKNSGFTAGRQQLQAHFGEASGSFQ